MRILRGNVILRREGTKRAGLSTMDYDAFSALLAQRHSCRGFLPEPLPRETVDRIIAAARCVPSWCNAQPWQVTITDKPATDKLRSALASEIATGAPMPDLDFPARYSGAYQDRRRACGWQLYEAVGVARGDRAGSARQMMENYSFFGAPHVAILSSPRELGGYGALDCGGFVTAFTLAAQSLGVATIAQAAIAAYGPFLHRYFDIPDDRLILCAISFGRADPDHPANGFRTGRADPDEIVDWRSA